MEIFLREGSESGSGSNQYQTGTGSETLDMHVYLRYPIYSLTHERPPSHPTSVPSQQQQKFDILDLFYILCYNMFLFLKYQVLDFIKFIIMRVKITYLHTHSLFPSVRHDPASPDPETENFFNAVATFGMANFFLNNR